MTQQTKQQKIDEIHRMLREYYEDFEGCDPLDFSKLLVTVTKLNEDQWPALMEEFRYSEERLLQHPWEAEFEYGSLDIEDDIWLEDQYEDYGLTPGSVVVELLDQMKNQLGPDPDNTLILTNDSGHYYVVKAEEPPNKMLDRCLDALRKAIEEQAEKEQAEKEQLARIEAEQVERQKRNKLREDTMDALERVGYERALQLLTAAENE